MYKNKNTSYLVKEIPVETWKKVRAKCLTEGINAVSDVVVNLLEKWVKDEVKYGKQ